MNPERIDPANYIVGLPDEPSHLRVVDGPPPPYHPPSGPTAVRNEPSPEKPLANADRFLPKADEAARQLIHSWILFGPKEINHLDPSSFPSALSEVAAGTLDAMISNRVRDLDGVVAYFVGAPDGIRDELIESTQGYAPHPQDCGPLLETIRRYDFERQKDNLAGKLKICLERGDDPAAIFAEFAGLESAGTRRTRSMIVNGMNSYPTIVPPESVMLGQNWLRRGDFATLISGAGGGKSVGTTQATIAWALGLPYFGITSPRPLRILLFSVEDDGVTIGHCREGFLDHSKAITGRQLTARDLDPLDDMIRTEFIREHVGERFHVHLDRLLQEFPADLVIVNPLLSYIGGEVVAKASEWLRAGLMPVLQKHAVAALVVHHTPKLSKDSWDTIDDTYSGIGGGEIANAPRAVLTLKPTPVDDLCVLTVSKRKTTGWKSGDGKFVASYFIRRTDNPERPAWLPVDHDEAVDLIAASKGTAGKGGRKVSLEHIAEALETGDMQRQPLLDWIMRKCNCSDRPARDAVNAAVDTGTVCSYTEDNPQGGKSLRWFSLKREKIQ